jgi:hypothetical protein
VKATPTIVKAVESQLAAVMTTGVGVGIVDGDSDGGLVDGELLGRSDGEIEGPELGC